MLIFSSSVPDRDGALESSKGEAKGPIARLSRLAVDSSLQLVRLDEISEARGECLGVSSSRKRRMRERFGGRSSSADSVGEA